MTKNIEIKNNSKLSQEIQEDSSVLITSDLGITSALMSLGYELDVICRNNPDRKAHFVLIRDEGIDEAVEEYLNDTLQVSARKFFDTLRALKSRLHAPGDHI